MPRNIIADTSCLILFEKIGHLELLRLLFGQILITPEIAMEFGEHLPDWIVIQEPQNITYQRILEASLGKGESSALALALEYDSPLVIIDDHKGRKMAEMLGIRITGSLGVIIDAKLSGKIMSVLPIIEKIRHTNFRLSKELEEMVIEKANEKVD